MTRKEGVLLASRAFALYLLCWALSDLTYVPQTLLSLRHHSSVLITRDYWSAYYGVELTFRIVRIVALFGVASWLYRCGRRVEDFLLPIKQAVTTQEN
jgi:uncharacterized membrane protein